MIQVAEDSFVDCSQGAPFSLNLNRAIFSKSNAEFLNTKYIHHEK